MATARRVKKVTGSVVTVFVYDVGGHLVAEYGGAQTTGGTSYVTQDYLGSTRVVTGQNQEVKGRYDYLPFVEEVYAGRQGYSGDNIRQKFTGYERDETGLDYAKARYYVSGQGRFTSVDPFDIVLETGITAMFDPEKAERQLAGYLTNAQQWNRYNYVGNNPLKYVDPTGEKLKLTGETEAERQREFERIKKLVEIKERNYFTSRRKMVIMSTTRGKTGTLSPPPVK